MKPIRVEMKLKNNILFSLRENTGLSSKNLAEKIGICYVSYLNMESLRTSPLCPSGEWAQTARKIAVYWKMLPEDLFPEAVLRVRKTNGSFAMNAQQIDRLLAIPRESLPELPEEIPDRAVFSGEVRLQVEKLLEEYRTKRDGDFRSPVARERNIKIWKMHYGWDDGIEQTDNMIASHFDLSTERIKQIVAKLERHFASGLRRFADHN